MKIAVVGSNGRVGQLVVAEATKRGYEVVGFTRNDKDALALTKEDLVSFDAVVDAVGGWTPETIPNITNAMVHLASVLDGAKTRLIVVGGAGSLFVNKERTITVDMDPNFPESWKPLSNAHVAGLKVLRESSNLNWTYISPACNFVADGEKTGEYKLGGEELVLSSAGTSEVSYADYAIALVDVIEAGKYNKERISVVAK